MCRSHASVDPVGLPTIPAEAFSGCCLHVYRVLPQPAFSRGRYVASWGSFRLPSSSADLTKGPGSLRSCIDLIGDCRSLYKPIEDIVTDTDIDMKIKIDNYIDI